MWDSERGYFQDLWGSHYLLYPTINFLKYMWSNLDCLSTVSWVSYTTRIYFRLAKILASSSFLSDVLFPHNPVYRFLASSSSLLSSTLWTQCQCKLSFHSYLSAPIPCQKFYLSVTKSLFVQLSFVYQILTDKSYIVYKFGFIFPFSLLRKRTSSLPWQLCAQAIVKNTAI